MHQGCLTNHGNRRAFPTGQFQTSYCTQIGQCNTNVPIASKMASLEVHKPIKVDDRPSGTALLYIEVHTHIYFNWPMLAIEWRLGETLIGISVGEIADSPELESPL